MLQQKNGCLTTIAPVNPSPPNLIVSGQLLDVHVALLYAFVSDLDHASSVSFILSLINFHFHATLGIRAYFHIEIVLSTHAKTILIQAQM